MRKVSKNRTDDDIISSTNGSGSLHNEENQDLEQSVENNEKGSVSRNDDKSANDASDEEKKPDSSKKGKSKKPKSKKKKAIKTKKAEEDEEEYEVEEVIDSKRIRGKLHYLIRWKGYTADNDTWEPENTLSCPELINKFNEEKENSKDEEAKTLHGRKGLKRKSNNKQKTSPKKTKKKQWDSEEADEKADEEAEYEVERILEVHHKKSGERDFLIHWKGWASKFDSWEPESNLNCPELIKKFMTKVDKARSSESRSLRVAPETTNRFTLQAPSSGRRLSKRKNQRQRVRYDNAE